MITIPWWLATAILAGLVGGTILAVREIRDNPAFAFSVALLYEIASKQVSVLYLDGVGTFITESGTVSEYTGAGGRFALYNALVIAGVVIATRFLRRRERPEQRLALNPVSFYVGVGVLGAILAAQFLNLLLTGKVALPGTGVTRWNFWTVHAVIPQLRDIFGVLMVFIPATAACVYYVGKATQRRHMTAAGLVLLIMYVLFLVLTGQRFHGFIFPLALFLGAYVTFRARAHLPIVTPRLVFSLGVLGFVFVVYGLIEFQGRGLSERMGGAGAGLIYRALVLQGHTYWNAESLLVRDGPTGHIPDFLRGLELVVKGVGSSQSIDAYELHGINFANSWPASSIMVVGWLPTLITCILVGLFIGWGYHFMHRLMLEGAFLRIPLVSYLLLWQHTVYTRGSLELLDEKFALFLLVVVIMSLGVRTARETKGMDMRDRIRRLRQGAIPRQVSGVPAAS